MTSAVLGGQPYRSRLWWPASGVLLVVAAGYITVGLHGHQQALPGPVAARPGPMAAGATTPAPLAPVAVVAHSVLTSLRIPAVSVDVPLSTLGLNLDGTVQVPTDVQEPGWFRLGPSPG